MLEATCHCGAVRIEVPRVPEQLTSCNCSICRRLGWIVAYYGMSEVTIHGETDTYAWGDRMLRFHRCRVCGCATHWWPENPTRDRMGVNARLLPPEALAGSRIRRFDGADTWTFLDP